MAAEALSPVQALVPAITLLGFGAAAALASKALKLSPIVGYLIVGILIGPHVFGLLAESSETHFLAELGIVFLLFDIGMHISMRELRESRNDLLRLAPAHLVLSAVVFTLIIGLIGIDWPIATAIGVSLALSSTAVVSSVLKERGLNSCPLGRSSTHVLIFQDIIAIFLLIYVASMAPNAEGVAPNMAVTMGLAAVQAVIAFAAAILAGRFLVNPVFRALAATRNDEAFTAFTLLIVLGAACLTYYVGLSLTLGAFLAGLAVSGTPFRHQIQTETGPFRGLLLSFFFISVGLMIDLPALLDNLPVIIGLAFGLLLIKSGLGYLAARLNGWTRPGATQLGFMLAQGSEFTLVVLSLAVVSAALDARTETIIVAAIAVSLALAPSWAGLGMRLSRKLAQHLKSPNAAVAPPDAPSLDRPVIVFGMTDIGRIAVDALRDHDIPYIALDIDPDRFMAAVADGYNVKFGDAGNMRLIDAIGANNARAVVLGAPRFEVSKSITPTINRKFPNMVRFTTVASEAEAEKFETLGIHAWHSVTRPRGLEMTADMLRVLGVGMDDISDWLSRESERFDIDDVSDDVFEELEEDKDEPVAA